MKGNTAKTMRQKVMETPERVYKTRTYQYWIDANGHLCRARLEDLDTMAMYEPGAIDVLD